MFINGEWILRKDIPITNPYSGDIIGYIPSLSKEEVDESIKIAKEHCQYMEELKPSEKYKVLMSIGKEIGNNKEKLSKILSEDVGKPIRQSIIEVDRTIGLFKLGAFYCKEMRGETINIDDGIIITKREPIGLVGCITPFNFPLNTSAHKIVPSIVCGNSIVHHPSLKAPLILVELAKIIERVFKKYNIPLGCYNLLTGYGDIVGETIVKSDLVDAISFTGSVEVGEGITKKAGFKKILLELGGINPLIVLKDADLKKSAKNCVKTKFLNAGQVCISTGKVLVEKDVSEKFIELVVEEVKKLKVGNPLDKDTDIGPVITNESAIRIENLINKSINEYGGELIYGGKRENQVIYPTIIKTTNEDILCNTEIFGPVLPIVEVNDINEALNYANNSIYGLHAGIFTKDIDKGIYLANKLKYGGVLINNSPTFRMDNMPFGGVKKSGLGREGVKYAIEELSELKTIVIRHNYGLL